MKSLTTMHVRVRYSKDRKKIIDDRGSNLRVICALQCSRIQDS